MPQGFATMSSLWGHKLEITEIEFSQFLVSPVGQWSRMNHIDSEFPSFLV